MGNGSFEAKRYGTADSTLRKYKNTELYLLLPVLFPSEALETIDRRYLDSKHAPIVSPLLKHMQIELYNEKWLQSHDSHIPTKFRINNLPNSELDAIAFEPHPETMILLESVMNEELDVYIIVDAVALKPTVKYDVAELHQSVTTSR